MSVVAFDRRRLRELRAEIAVWPELTEKGLAQRLRVLLRIWVRLLDLRRAAFDVVARQFHWHLGGEAEGDEEGGIVDVNVHRLLVSVDWLGERQREVKRKQPLVVVERIVLRGFEWKIFVLPDIPLLAVTTVPLKPDDFSSRFIRPSSPRPLMNRIFDSDSSFALAGVGS